MEYNEEQLVDKFIETISVQGPNTKKLFVISFIAPTGCGKSFVAKKIAEKANLYIASNDKIRRFLNDLGFEGNHPLQSVVEKTAVTTTKYLFQNKISHIIDVDLIRFHEKTKEMTESYGAKLYMIEIICPKELALQRIKNREENIKLNKEDNLSRGTVEDYFERKKLHETLQKPKFFFRIDTSKNVDSQIDNLISKFKKEKII